MRSPTACSVWCVAQPGVPAVSATLLIDGGSAQDPGGRPGLASLVADFMDEGAGGRDAIALADALSRLGARLEVDVGADMTAISATTLSRFLVARARYRRRHRREAAPGRT